MFTRIPYVLVLALSLTAIVSAQQDPCPADTTLQFFALINACACVEIDGITTNAPIGGCVLITGGDDTCSSSCPTNIARRRRSVARRVIWE